jgi:hypothetical protein
MINNRFQIALALDKKTKYEAYFTKILGDERPTPVVQTCFYRNDQNYNIHEKSQNSKKNKLNLATPIILFLIAVFLYLIFKK